MRRDLMVRNQMLRRSKYSSCVLFVLVLLLLEVKGV
jgi:hypothetical protein